MSDTVLKIKSLSKSFGSVRAMESLDLVMKKGEAVALLGPNGAGKSTTIRHITGMLAPDSGEVEILGLDPKEKQSLLALKVGYLPENPGFYSSLSVEYNLRYFANFYPHIDPAAQVDKYIASLGLEEKRKSKAGSLSKGLKARLAIARILLHEPEILILDEPVSGLDPEASLVMRKLIGDLVEAGRTLILCTHNLTIAEELCSRVVVLKNRLLKDIRMEETALADGPPDLLIETGGERAGAVKLLASLEGVKDAALEGDRLIRVRPAAERDIRAELSKKLMEGGFPLLSLTEDKQSLEDFYLKLIRSGKEEK